MHESDEEAGDRHPLFQKKKKIHFEVIFLIHKKSEEILSHGLCMRLLDSEKHDIYYSYPHRFHINNVLDQTKKNRSSNYWKTEF